MDDVWFMPDAARLRQAPSPKAGSLQTPDSGRAIQRVCSQFVLLCRRLNLFTHAVVAIDGSKFKAVNSRDRNFTPTKIDRRVAQIEQSIQRYLEEMETAARTQPAEAPAKAKRLDRKIQRLREQMKHLAALKEQLQSQDDQQLSTTDADARSMTSDGRATGVVGYNVQAAVDAKHHLVVAHEVTNNVSDRGQLANMAVQAKDAMGKPTLQAIADRGYFSGPQIKACEEAGVAAYVPKPMTSNSKAEGRYSKSDFIYVARDDQCNARLASGCAGARQLTKRDCASTHTGPTPAAAARSRRNAQRARSAACAAGSTRT